MPDEMEEKVGPDLTAVRDFGTFNTDQVRFLAYHRDCVYDEPNRRDQLSFALLH